MYAKLLAGLDGIRDRAIFLIACFCDLRPSELFGLNWGCYSGSVFTIVNSAWRGRLLAGGRDLLLGWARASWLPAGP